MSIDTATAPDLTPASPDDAAPIIKRSAVPTGQAQRDAQAAKLAAIADSGRFRATGKGATRGDWYTGFCSPGPCQDGKPHPETGAARHWCLGLGENGAKITPRYLFCACTCHRTNPAAVQVPEDLQETNTAASLAAAAANRDDA